MPGMKRSAGVFLLIALVAAEAAVCAVSGSEYIRRREKRLCHVHDTLSDVDHLPNPVPGDPHWRLHTLPKILAADDDQCRRLFRLGIGGVRHLVRTVRRSVMPHRGPRGFPADVRCAMFLYYCAHGCSEAVVAAQFGCSVNTVHRVLNATRRGILKHYDSFVFWPSRAEMNDIAYSFHCRRGLDGVIGCVDGTHIPVRAPLRHKDSYVNRKGWPSLSCMCVCDDRLRFTYVVPDIPGCCHDSRSFNASTLPIAKLCKKALQHGKYILGDPAYAYRVYCLTPYRTLRILRTLRTLRTLHTLRTLRTLGDRLNLKQYIILNCIE